MLGKTWFILTALVLNATTGNAESQPQLMPLDGRQKAAIIMAEAMKNGRLQSVLTQHVHPKASILTLEMLDTASQEEFLSTGADGAPGLSPQISMEMGTPIMRLCSAFHRKRAWRVAGSLNRQTRRWFSA